MHAICSSDTSTLSPYDSWKMSCCLPVYSMTTLMILHRIAPQENIGTLSLKIFCPHESVMELIYPLSFTPLNVTGCCLLVKEAKSWDNSDESSQWKQYILWLLHISGAELSGNITQSWLFSLNSDVLIHSNLCTVAWL